MELTCLAGLAGRISEGWPGGQPRTRGSAPLRTRCGGRFWWGRSWNRPVLRGWRGGSRKAGRGASRGPGGPPHFGRDAAADFVAVDFGGGGHGIDLSCGVGGEDLGRLAGGPAADQGVRPTSDAM